MRLIFNASNLKSAGGVVLLAHLLPGFLSWRDEETETPEGTSQAATLTARAPVIDQLLLYHHPALSSQVNAWIAALPSAQQSRVEAIPFRAPDGLRRFYWEQVTLPQIIRDRQVDVLFSFGNTGPLVPGCRQILYLQQAIPYSRYRPRQHGLKWLGFQWLYGFLINLAQLGSQRIIVPTRWLVEPMRQALFHQKPNNAYRVSLPGLPSWPEPAAQAQSGHISEPSIDPSIESTIVSVQNNKSGPQSSAGGDAPPTLSPAEQAVLETLAVRRKSGTKLLLYPCNLAPYKNIPALLEAVHILNTQNQNFQLILTFNEASAEYFPCKKQVLTAVAQCPPNRVMLAGTFSRAGLRQLYALTDLLVFPSLVETLGLPLLEAMALGIPIVALDGQSVISQCTEAAFAREICQDAARYAPPGNAPALANQIQQVLRDPELSQRLGQAGRQRAESFSWTQHVQEILGA